MTIETLHPVVGGVCASCGGDDFMLAEDFTKYTPCAYNGEKFEPTYTDDQASDADDAVRFFCANCGTRHIVPKELQ